ncbi:response regulator transcription factor [Allosalinactinospora lopnorensis]|uniref:response regulator transcription factor n=1 Tax=Allosalinactinospora lopnorensis TaxID=1352348 RepID=UPI000623C044|nr:response regulator transcription factor [Allosalinactinospora lopnorensis]
MSISVLIADDQETIRTGYRFILDAQNDIDVVGEAADGAEAVERVRRLRPDVCLMDIRMPVMDGLAALAAIRRLPETTTTRVVVVTTFDIDEYVYGALRAGAAGFILKNSGARLLAEAVRTAVHGEALVSPAVTTRLLCHFTGADGDTTATDTVEPLTAREREVAVQVARGRTNNEIAGDLFISLGTVKSHLTRIQEKLRARNRVEIAAWVWERGLVP